MKAVIRYGVTALALAALFVGTRGFLETVRGQAPAPASTLVAPSFKVDPNWPKVPNGWIFGQASNVAVDFSNDHVWLLQRPDSRGCGGLTNEMRSKAAPPVLEFDNEGNFVQGWGGQAMVGLTGGIPYDWPWCEHGIHVDYKGFVWVAGRGDASPGSDNSLLKFTKAGKFVLQIGYRSQSKGNKDPENMNSPADMWVHPKSNEVFVADGYGNRRLIVYDADSGKYKRMWGAFGNVPTDPAAGEKDPPDTEEAYAGLGPQQFVRPVHGITVSKDDLVYLSDRGGKRVQIFTLDGKYVNQIWVDRDCHAPACSNGNTAVNSPLSPDPEQKFMHAGARSTGRVWTFDRKTGQPLGFFGSFGKDPGQFDTLHGMAIDGKGNLFSAEVRTPGRFQKFVRQPDAPAAAARAAR